MTVDALRRPSRTERRARAAVAVLFFTNGALFANLLPRYPQIKADLGIGNTAYGLAVAAFPAGAIAAGLAAGVLVRRLGSARVAVAGTLLTAAGTLAAGLAQSVAVFAAALFLAGAMDAVTDVAQNAHALRVQRRYGRSLINSFHAIWSVGAVTGGCMAAAAIALDLSRGQHLLVSGVLFGPPPAWPCASACPDQRPRPGSGRPPRPTDSPRTARRPPAPARGTAGAPAHRCPPAGRVRAGGPRRHRHRRHPRRGRRQLLGHPLPLRLPARLGHAGRLRVHRPGRGPVRRPAHRRPARRPVRPAHRGPHRRPRRRGRHGPGAGRADGARHGPRLRRGRIRRGDPGPGGDARGRRTARPQTRLRAHHRLLADAAGLPALPPVVGLVADATSLRVGLLVVPFAGLLVVLLGGVLRNDRR